MRQDKQSYKSLTMAQKRDVMLEAYKKTGSTVKVAQMLGITPYAAYLRCRTLGLSPRKQGLLWAKKGRYAKTAQVREPEAADTRQPRIFIRTVNIFTAK